MRTVVIGREPESTQQLIERIRSLGYTIVEDDPELVISFGGDGTLLFSERKYPSVPKLPIRDKSICNLCPDDPLPVILEKLEKKEFTIKEMPKLTATINYDGKTYTKVATNEVYIRNHEPYYALRLSMKSGSFSKALIGDGIVVATTYGSTGYFHSITKKSFDKGFGVAFNNMMSTQEALLIDKPDIHIRIRRNKADVGVDNEENYITVAETATVDIQESEQKLRIVQLNT